MPQEPKKNSVLQRYSVPSTQTSISEPPTLLGSEIAQDYKAQPTKKSVLQRYSVPSTRTSDSEPPTLLGSEIAQDYKAQPTKKSILQRYSVPSTRTSDSEPPTLFGSEIAQDYKAIRFSKQSTCGRRSSQRSTSFVEEVLSFRSGGPCNLHDVRCRPSVVSMTGLANTLDIEQSSHRAGFERIFESYLDIDGDGLVTRQDISRVFKALFFDDTEICMQIMSAFDAEGDVAWWSAEQCESLLFKQKARGFRGKLAVMLLQIGMPFFYSVCTRMPFICIALETVEKRSGSVEHVACVLGTYQTCRAVANVVVSKLRVVPPVVMHATMTTLGLVGWGFNYLNADGQIWVLLTLGLVGLSESVVCLQQALMAEVAADSGTGIPSENLLTKRLRCQYTAISCGSSFAYIVGGWLYSSYGFKDICLLCVACEAANLVCVAAYFLVTTRSVFQPEMEGVEYLRKLVVKLTAIDELVRAALGLGPKPCELEEVKLSAAKNQAYIASLRELFGTFLGWMPSHKRNSGFSRLTMRLRLSSNMPRNSQTRASMGSSDRDQATLWFLTSSGKLDLTTLKAKLVPLMQLHVHANKLQQHEFEAMLARAVRLLARTYRDKVSIQDFLAFTLPRVQLSLNPDSRLRVDTVFWYIYLIVVTQAVMAFCIGTFLSTAVLMYSTHGMDSSRSGLMLGIGEGLGALVIAVTSNSWLTDFLGGSHGSLETSPTKDLILALISRPLHVPIVLLLIGAATMLFACPSTGVAIASQMVALACNDLSVTLLNELTATSTPPEDFQSLQSMGQWLRRLGNMIMAVSGPILHGFAPWLPWTVSGGVVFLWGLFVWGVLFVRAKEIAPFFENQGIISIFSGFVSHDHKGRKSTWHVHELAHQSNSKQASETLSLLKSMEIDVEQRLFHNQLDIEKFAVEIDNIRTEQHAGREEVDNLKKLFHEDVHELRRELTSELDNLKSDFTGDTTL